MVNWEFFDNINPTSARELVDGLRAGREIAPSRGAPRLVTWKQAGRILAGFPDDQATGGHTGGGPTLAGLRIAKEHGWTPDAPAPDAPAAGAPAGDRSQDGSRS
jgi:NADH-quinone oxidoreductase subunit E